ncbi:MAG: VanW family protein [Christensenellales bacterium]|jgi:vancomycin resistance protein YoaR
MGRRSRGNKRRADQPEARRAAFQEDEPGFYPADDPWQADFIPQAQGSFYFEEEPPPEHDFYSYPDEPQIKPRSRQGRWALIALLSLAAILATGFYVYSLSRAEDAFNQKLVALNPNVFYEGIYVDGKAIGGMSFAQAESALSQQAAENQQALSITLKVDDTAYQITQQQLPFERNICQVLEEAWSIGRQGFPWMLGEGSTPFEWRYSHITQTRRDKAYFTTRVTYDSQHLRSLCESIADQVNRAPVNAVIASFDFSTKAFSVTRDVPGRQIALNELIEPLSQALDRGDFQTTISLTSTPVLPRVTSSDLQNSFAMLASFSTKTTSDDDRNYNIALAADALNGKTLMPGETLSFNEATGQRTIEKGYRGAPAIAGGVLIDDVGGGVCQVSSTLFNAVALAGMTIVERSPHAWPSSYVDKGMDATVNWPNLDFKFRNDKDTPVFLIAYYNKRKVTVELFGMRTGPGESIMLEAEVTSSTPPPYEPIMQQNPSLAPGTRQELKKPRTGYTVDTYRVFLRDGVAYRREKLFTSRYPMVQQVIEYN